MKNCSLGIGLMLENFVQDRVVGEGPCAGAGERIVRSGPSEEKKQQRPMPLSPQPLEEHS